MGVFVGGKAVSVIGVARGDAASAVGARVGVGSSGGREQATITVALHIMMAISRRRRSGLNISTPFYHFLADNSWQVI